MPDRAARFSGPTWMVALPLAIVGVCAALLAVPATRPGMQWALGEQRPVELMTFALCVVGGAWALRLAWSRRAERFEAAFFAFFGVGLLVVAGEEVAWGQWFVPFETPEAIAAVNTQGELTWHNHQVFNDHLEAFPLLFGVAGLVGIGLGRFRTWAGVAVPRALWVWFGLIAALSAVDLVQDFYVLQDDFDGLINWMDEAVEMMVGAAALLYVALHAWRPAPEPAPAGAWRLREPARVRPSGPVRSAVSGRPM